jgi:hypothetical protein
MAPNFRFFLRARFLLILGAAIAIQPGCGSDTKVVTDPKGKAERVQENSLAQLGDVLRIRAEEGAPPPASVADVVKYEKAFPLACGKVKDGQIVLFFGVPLQEGVEDKILAHEKLTPEAGGHVLMQDGKTIKKVTADEFKAAPKAGK